MDYLRYTTALASGLILFDYHSHGRFIYDGIFSDNKLPLQYHMDKSKIPEIAKKGQENLELADLAYKPVDILKSDSKANSRYEFLERLTDDNGLKVNAFRDTQTNKIVIGIAGLEIKEAENKLETAKDVLGALRSTAGAKSNVMDNLVAFTKKVKETYGEISNITGHSLGSYQAIQLKAIADKQGLIPKDCELYLYDTPGVSRTLAKELGESYGVTEDDLQKSLHNKNVYTFINDFNSYNTLGALPGNVLMATNPSETKYREYNLTELKPQLHFVPDFRKNFEQGNFKYEAHNYAHARGPEYLTAITAGTFLGGIHPLGYALYAEPVLRNAQGIIGDAVTGDFTDLLHSTDAKIVDGLKSQDGEAPNMVAYKQLNQIHAECFNTEFQRLAKGRRDLDPEKRAEFVKLAEEYAGKPEVLEEAAKNKVAACEKTLEERWANRSTTSKGLQALAWIGGQILGKGDVADLAQSVEEIGIKEAKSALEELKTYRQDYEKHKQKNDSVVPIASNILEKAKEAVSNSKSKDSPVNPKDLISLNYKTEVSIAT